MAIDVTSVSAEEAAALGSQAEGHFYDRKSCRIRPASLTKVIASFANADGGELHIGIEDDGTWAGFAVVEDANGHLQAFEDLFPLGQYYQYEFLELPGSGFVLHVHVHKHPQVVRASDGAAYIRRGAQKIKCTTDDSIRRLELNKGISSFESETVAVEPEWLYDSDVYLNFIGDLAPAADPTRWLRKQLLIRQDKPTVAAVLLFAEEPQVALPKRCAIKVSRFATSGAQGRAAMVGDPLTIEGCLYEQIYAAVQTTKDLVESEKMLEDGVLQEISYPEVTLHEIITNAVIHRDYSIADDIHIRVFDNRVEVESPGVLAGHVTVDNILDERFARNGNVVRLINKFKNPPNKDIGEGLNTAFNAMSEIRLKVPKVIQKSHSVVVDIRHERLAAPEDMVLEFLSGHDSISNKEARDLCAIKEDYRMYPVLKRLRDQGLIEVVPGTARGGTRYRKKTR